MLHRFDRPSAPDMALARNRFYGGIGVDRGVPCAWGQLTHDAVWEAAWRAAIAFMTEPDTQRGYAHAQYGSGAAVLAEATAARHFPRNTCPASRQVFEMGTALIQGEPYPLLDDDPGAAGESLLHVVADLWKLRGRGDQHGCR